ncbi:MAG: 16S rRNA (cytosine(1402)-N(4))-methyltransferase RsmH [Candidatus Eisenbacteria bacterium]|nr:16S rRNA (cytosine(1402)-N(4))-methyltransferase RsmH [Candidatus Eisenbacteria bacterium]
MRSDDPALGGGGHEPVLAREVAEALRPFPGGIFVDATFGLGNHTAAVLDAVEGIERVVGIDRDGEILEEAGRRFARSAVPVDLVRGNFRDLRALLGPGAEGRVGGILFDLGIGSFQIDRPERGFSYRSEGALDMRMDRSGTRSAYDVVNGYSAEELARVIRRWGEERNAGAIARAIVRARRAAPIAGTRRLAEVVSSRLSARGRIKGLARVFQAIRIEVNEEIASLEEGLSQAVDVLAPGGHIAVIGYHSIEDRVVKQRFQEWARGCVCPPHLPVCRCGRAPALRLSSRRAIRPSEEEVARNPRARSARLRAAVRIAPEGREGRGNG